MANRENAREDPESKKCKKCNQTPTSGPKCVNCQCIMHPGCVKYLRNVKQVDDETIICCDKIRINDSDNKTLENDSSRYQVGSRDFNKLLGSTEEIQTQHSPFHYLHQIIDEKDNYIKYLMENINFLQEQVRTLNSVLLQISSFHGNDHTAQRVSLNLLPTPGEFVNNDSIDRVLSKDSAASADTVSKRSKQQQEPSPSISEINKPSNKQTKLRSTRDNPNTRRNGQIHDRTQSNLVSTAKSKQTTISTQSRQLNCDGNTKQENRIQNNIQRNNKIIGCAVNCDGISAIPNKQFLFVSKLDPNVKEDQLKQLLKTHFPEVECQKLESRNTNFFSSFKVIIDETNYDKAWDPEIWPKDAQVSPFFRKRTNKYFAKQQRRY